MTLAPRPGRKAVERWCTHPRWPRTLMLAALATAGCEALEGRVRMPLAFEVATGSGGTNAGESAPGATEPVEPPPPPSSPRLVQAPARATRWHVAERELTAPDGLAFRVGLAGALEGGDPRDVLAWMVGAPGSNVVGELWFYPAEGEPEKIAGTPGFVPTGPSCRHATQLTQSGPGSVMLEVHARCKSSLLARAPTRSVAVLAPRRAPSEIVGFRMADPAPGESLDLRVTSQDRDQDGRDDVELVLTLTPPEGASASARFIWLDRAAGLSRDASEPRASFERQAAAAKTPEAARQAWSALRRLYSSACAESAVPRLFAADGDGLSCGDLDQTFEGLARTLVSSALERRSVPEALTALQGYLWQAPTRAAAAKFENAQLKRIWKQVTRRRVVKLVPLKSRPRASGSVPLYSPLSFHADGSLLLLTQEGVVRSAPDGRYEYDASAEVDPWATVVVSPTGDRLTGVAFPCDRSEVGWLRTSEDGTPLPPLPTDLMAPRPGSCKMGKTFDAPAITPLAWTDRGLSAYVGLARVGPSVSLPVPPGSATSPNGRFSILPTRWGLLVTGDEQTTLWEFKDSRLARHLEHCVVSNNAQAAACVLVGRAYVVLPDPKSG